MAGQGGRLCHPGPRRILRCLHLRVLQQRRGAAAVRDRGAAEGRAMSRIDRLICQVLPRAFLMALTAEGRLVELQVARRDRPSLVDGVYLGRLERVMADLDAAFVDIGTGRSGFLRAEDRAGIDGWPPAGAPVLVQVRGEGESDPKGEGKGPRLSMNIAVSGRYLVYHPLGSGVSFSRRIDGESERERLAGHVGRLLDGGIVLRTAAAGAPAAVLQAEMDRRQEKIRVRWHNGPMPAFDIDDVAGQIDTALAPRIVLPSGVEVLFEPGETLCAIDVDSAGAGGRQGRAPRRPVEVNLEAVPAIAQQLRLRNLAGAIVVDFVTMRSAYDRNKVQAALAEALREDPVPAQVYGFTRLGHFELTRARRGVTLAGQLQALEHTEE